MGMEMSGNAMMGGGGGMTPAEAILVSDRNRNYDDGLFGSGSGSWVFFLFFLLAWGNGGWGGFGNRNMVGEAVATNADLQRGFDTQAILGKLDGINNGLCDGFYAVNTGMLNGFHGVDNALCSGFYSVNNAIQQARFDSQQCCCETNRNIDALRYESAKNTCDIVNAIKEDGAATRALMTQNTIQELRDQLQAAQLQLGNVSQTQTLINELRPCARPAYITCSPYQAYGYPYNQGYNWGCGSNTCCGA